MYIGGSSLNIDILQVQELGKQLNIQNLFLSATEEEKLSSRLQENSKNSALHLDFMKDVNFYGKVNGEDFDKDFEIGLLPQAFTVDTWLIYETVIADKENPRRRVSIEDILYGVFGNEDPKSLLQQRVTGKNSDFMRLRDGVNYMGKLESAKSKIKESWSKNPEKWRNNIFTHWLLVLSTLSNRENYPKDQIYSSSGWQKKQTMTQTASYAELKHDTILYVEQAEADGAACCHPEAYVEPNLAFWTELKNLVTTLGTMQSKVESGAAQEPQNGTADRFLKSFVSSLDMLITAVSLELNGQPFNKELDQKLKGIMYEDNTFYEESNLRGWYSNMFYECKPQCLDFDPEVTDIFTAAPDEPTQDPGAILHIGTKEPRVGLIILKGDNGKEKCFMLGGYNAVEMHMPFEKRMTDKEWQNMLTGKFMKS
jgi:hypothetical protein